MTITSLIDNVEYHDNRPTIQVLLESESGKEIRIAFKKGQIMRKHRTPFPIVVEIFDGRIDFGVNEAVHTLHKGNLIALEGGVPHDLKALKDSIVRLSIHRADTAERVADVAKT